MALEFLRPFLDVDIMAALRPAHLPDRIASIRWTSRPMLGFPSSGYRVFRIERLPGGAVARSLVGTYYLPATDSWAAFEADLLARTPVAGPYFDAVTEDDLGFLLPLVRAVDPRIPIDERLELLPEIAEFFGHLHTAEPFYHALIWSRPIPPTFDELLADPVAGPITAAYYGLEVMKFLESLAVRYEYAVLLGLATDDDITGLNDMGYELGAWWGSRWGKSLSTVIDGQSLTTVDAPEWMAADVIEGDVGHPAFAKLGWTPPDWYVPVDGTGQPIGVEATYPRPGATHSALRWDLPRSDDERLLHADQPVTFLVKGYEHGASTAGDASAPPAPPARRFKRIQPDALHVPVAASDVHAVDGAGRPWPPLEGWMHYRVWGVNLLGIASDDHAETTVVHVDSIGPRPPVPRFVDDTSLALDVDGSTRCHVRLQFDASQDFREADAAEFRIETSWTSTEYQPVTVNEVTSVDLTEAAVAASSPADLKEFVGGTLMIGGRSHRISRATARTLFVALHAGEAPTLGAGTIVRSVDDGVTTRVANVKRPKPIVGLVAALVSEHPLVVELPVGRRRPGPEVSLYLHLLRTSVTARASGDEWVIDEPSPGTPARSALDALRATGRLATDLAGSPFIVYPAKDLKLDVQAPPGFVSGTITVTARSSDAKPYVIGPAVTASDPALVQLEGNEGHGVDATISATSTIAPEPVSIPPAPPVQWATSATRYDPVSRFELRWDPAVDAVRYEVWRLLEPALPILATPRSDARLATDAAAREDLFELRTAEAWTTSHIDELPGRAPLRAVYLVRPVSAAGVVGSFSAPLGPVRVPDVRPPADAHIAAVRLATPTEIHDGTRAVTIDVIGPQLERDDVGYVVERRPADASGSWTLVADIDPATQPETVGDRLAISIDDLDVQPGLDHVWRTVPYRVVDDPIDDTGTTKRTIRGRRSRSVVGRSVGPVNPPTDLEWIARGGARLRWVNGDRYQAIDVERLAGADGPARVLARLDGDASEYLDTTNTGLTATGAAYSYRLRCLAATGSATARVEGVVGAP